MNDHDTNHRPESPRGLIGDITKDVNLGEEIDLVVGVTATALTADQILKMSKSKDHKAMHLAKAGLGAAVATAAFTMMAREHRDRKKHFAKIKEERERGRVLYRERDLEAGYAESLTDSSDDDERGMAMVPHAHFRRGTSMHEEYRHRSRSRSRSRTRSPPPTRARSQSTMRHRKRSESPSGFIKFLQAVREGLEESQRQRHS